jgi:putative ABC transport system permease protein
MRTRLPQAGGRFIDPVDMKEQRRVVFLGDKLAANIFGKAEDGVGKTVMLGSSPFLVIGVLQPKTQDSSYSGRDNDKASIPGTTYLALTGEKYVDNMIFQASSNFDTEPLKKRILEILGKRKKFDPEDKEALSVWDTTGQFKFWDTFMLAFTGFLGVVGSLTLVVGGIGVSNIMNVVVEERTKEIGIKMALGAKQRFILGQFLLETLLVTGIGGAIGFAVSLTICAVFPKFGLTDFVGVPEVSPSVAAVTMAILGLIGLVAGWFPAREASRLDPVVAMKL